MAVSTALHTIGYYCGRHGPGLFDEPQNSFSNLAFLVGAVLAWRHWRRSGSHDALLPVLAVLLAAVGVGSFTFHSHPTPATLMGDLVPIQIFTVAVLAYTLVRVLGCSWPTTAALALAFVLLRQAWIALVPGWLGGGITHLPTLAALLVLVVALRRRGGPLWRYLAAGALSYMAALLARSWDVPLCHSFPLGLHWAWHLLTALAASLVLMGLVRHPQAQREGG